MKQTWTAGLELDASAELKAEFIRALPIRRRLALMLEGKANSAERLSLEKEGYEKANWAYLQADLIGYRRALMEVLALLD